MAVILATYCSWAFLCLLRLCTAGQSSPLHTCTWGGIKWLWAFKLQTGDNNPFQWHLSRTARRILPIPGRHILRPII